MCVWGGGVRLCVYGGVGCVSWYSIGVHAIYIEQWMHHRGGETPITLLFSASLLLLLLNFHAHSFSEAELAHPLIFSGAELAPPPYFSPGGRVGPPMYPFCSATTEASY